MPREDSSVLEARPFFRNNSELDFKDKICVHFSGTFSVLMLSDSPTEFEGFKILEALELGYKTQAIYTISSIKYGTN
jgi:hypothetical protein